MKKKILIPISAILANLFILAQAKAVCPICTIAVGAGIGITRKIGIDDSVTGLWIGGLTVSMILWTIDWLQKKRTLITEWKVIIALIFYLLIIPPLYYMNFFGHPDNKIFGIDKLILGIFLGSIFFFIGGQTYFYLKKKNNGKAYFPFQKVVMPVSPLIILSVVFYLITKQ